ncbi:MAG: hypothetical protein ACJ74J_21190 [Blastocatellia bacterium]
MNEAAAKLKDFERAVMWRKRWLALQDAAAVALLAAGLIAAALVLLSRLQVVRLHWSVALIAVVVVMGLIAWRWLRTRATAKEAAFLIDSTFALEDRVTTAHQILARNESQRVVERALIDDAASRLDDKRAASVAPYRLRAWHAIALVGVAAFVVAVMIPTRQLPGGEAIVEAQADIQTAGEQLEQVGEEIARLAPAESETAKLAREQAALGRSFRMSPESRAEALKQLSALEERIRQRHTELAETHADEIVSVAEKRLRNAIEPARKEKGEQSEASETAQAANDSDARDEDQAKAASDANKKTKGAKPRANHTANKVKAPATPSASSTSVAQSGNANRATNDAAQPSDAANATTPPKAESNPSDKSQAVSGNRQGQSKESSPKPDASQPAADATTGANTADKNPQSENPPAQSDAAAKADGQPRTDANAQADPQNPDAAQNTDAPKESSNPLANLAAEQAGKMLPQLSQELLKKAAELRDGKMSPEDIKRLQQSAELMARDLSRIAQSKEMQQMAEQLAKQITPEQVEQFARALGNQEQLKRELQATARLMMENQQAKSTVAGLAQNFAKWGEQFDRRNPNASGNRQPNADANPREGNMRGRGTPNPEDERAGREIMRAAGGLTDKADGPRRPTGQGRDARLSGNPQRGAGGEFLYLKSPAGQGASRAPYTSAYPQYRREAERSVERSQVPPRLRSVVKGYFDAINPDAAKKQ